MAYVVTTLGMVHGLVHLQAHPGPLVTVLIRTVVQMVTMNTTILLDPQLHFNSARLFATHLKLGVAQLYLMQVPINFVMCTKHAITS